MTDPNPLLSTMTGTTGALVAIVGGLLVASYIALDSEQQGAQRQLDDAEARLRVARSRERQASAELVEYEANEFLSDPEVLNALIDGVTDPEELRRRGEPTPLTDDQLRPTINASAHEIRTAYHTIDRTIERNVHVPVDEFDDLRDLSAFLTKVPQITRPERTDLWTHALDRVVNERVDERLNSEYVTAMEQVLGVVSPRSQEVVVEARRENLRAGVQRAVQRTEDIDDEVTRLRQLRDAVVKPNAQLWVGLIVLTYPTIVGVVLPILAMVSGPTDITGYIRVLVALFITGLLALLGHLAYFAIRLSRHHPRGSVTDAGVAVESHPSPQD